MRVVKCCSQSFDRSLQVNCVKYSIHSVRVDNTRSFDRPALPPSPPSFSV